MLQAYNKYKVLWIVSVLSVLQTQVFCSFFYAIYAIYILLRIFYYYVDDCSHRPNLPQLVMCSLKTPSACL